MVREAEEDTKVLFCPAETRELLHERCRLTSQLLPRESDMSDTFILRGRAT